MNSAVKRGLLGLLLLTTVIAAWFAPPLKKDEVTLSQRAQNTATRSDGINKTAINARSNTSAHTSTSVDVLTFHPRTTIDKDETEEARLFASTRWLVPIDTSSEAKHVAVETPPAPPQAPPLPFHVLGRYDDAGTPAIFLQYNEQNLIVRVGDTVVDQYKAESIKGTTLSLRYLPLNQLQTLEVGGTP